jgi:hypothetical protein
LIEVALKLFDEDLPSTYHIVSGCEQYIDREWKLSNQTKREYIEWLKKQLKEIFQQRERRRFSQSSV